jgi:hypothetical protein
MSDNKVAVPLSEFDMNLAHAAILFKIDYLDDLLTKSTTQEQTDNLRIQIGEYTLTAVLFRQLWRNSITREVK